VVGVPARSAPRISAASRDTSASASSGVKSI
jgi:hypothetical protein